MRIKTRQVATLAILLTSLLLSPVTLEAQATTNEWSRLTSVATGSKLSVKLKTGKKMDGTLSNVSDTALTLLVKNTSTEVKRDDISTVHQVNGRSATKATLIGMGLGAGAGALAVAVEDSRNDGFEVVHEGLATGVMAVLGAGVGAIGGFLVGKTMKKRVLIYQAK